MRPITLINNWCKITEALFSKRIEDYLNEKNFFSKRQFGFCKGVLTIDAIEEVVKHTRKVKKFNYGLLIALDASSAFDTLNWNKIIYNIINVDNSIIKMVQSLLIDRKIILNDNLYNSQTGCPQGAKCSPLLWRIGLNDLLIDLDKISNLNVNAFADDTSLIIYSDNKFHLKENLNKAMILINKWCYDAEIKYSQNRNNVHW